MKYNSSNKPLVCMMTQSTCYKGTSKMAVKGVLWHSTGANNPNIKRYVQPDDNASNKSELIKIIGKNSYKNDWNHIKLQAGVNAFIGKLADGTVATVQTMPWDYKPWGCGAGSKGSCNNGWIQFEIAESSLSDKTYFNKVYQEACELTAYLCKMYNLDPNGNVTVNGVKVPVILCHADSHKLKLGSNHGDVLHWFKKHGKTMDDVRKDVMALMGNASSTTTTQISQSSLTTFKKGDVVKVVGDTYYNGKAVPSFVPNTTWIVHSVSGDRVVVDKSSDGKYSIMSPFKSNVLALVSETKPNTSVSTSASASSIIKKGSKVKVKDGAKTYVGGELASFVYKTTYTVLQEPIGNRVVIGLNGVITAAVNKKDLIIV